MDTQTPRKNNGFLPQVLLRGLILFLAANLIFAFFPPAGLGKVSAYNRMFPGRLRLPFGEDSSRSYNLSLNNLDAMFASHEVSARVEGGDSLRIILIGDSSVWGTLLSNPETLSGQLNSAAGQVCEKTAHFYNLGYPTISLTKDLLILNRAMAYKPDAIIWLTTLEAFPLDKQASSPLAAKNAAELSKLISQMGLEDLVPIQNTPDDFWSQTIAGRRRDLADLARLQLFGVMWGATGIDQDLAARYTPAELDFDADASFHDMQPGDDLSAALAWEALDAGKQLAGDVPILVVNEPILISGGRNSDLRYNLFYPRWAYDNFRKELKTHTENLGIAYLDAWDLVPAEEFTNSAIHLTPIGESLLARRILDALPQSVCLP